MAVDACKLETSFQCDRRYISFNFTRQLFGKFYIFIEAVKQDSTRPSLSYCIEYFIIPKALLQKISFSRVTVNSGVPYARFF